jgi:hypothetical protein
VSEDLKYLWTPETTLRLRDTSGRRLSKPEERCINCGAFFDASADPESALCPKCSHIGKFRNNEHRPDITDMARCKDPDGMVRCLLCAKLYPAVMGQLQTDQICSECRKDHRDSAKLVCAKCHITLARLIPCITDTGFIIRPNMVLHSSACNICEPQIKVSKAIEIELWEKTHKKRKTFVPMKSKGKG